MSVVRKALNILKRYGLKGFLNKAAEKKSAPDRFFDRVKQDYYAKEASLKSQRIAEGRFLYHPLITVVVPAFSPKEEFFRDLLMSLKAQTYTNFELVIADASPQADRTVERLTEEAGDDRFRYFALTENEGISGNTNRGLREAKGEYIGFLDHDDLLTPDALYEVIHALNQRRAELLYSDEDKISEDGNYAFQPHFKSDYNYWLLLSNNYICHFTVVSRDLLHRISEDGVYLRPEFDGSQDYDFVLRCVEKTDRICHIPRILYHWRESASSTAGDSYTKTYTEDAGKRAVEAHLARVGIRAEVKNRLEIGCYRLSPVPSDQIGILGRKTICNGRVDSCGLYYREGGTIGHAFRGLKASFKGYCRRAVLLQEMSGCLISYASVHPAAEKKAGKPDLSLPEPLRSMEYCERVRRAGFSIVVDPEETVVIQEPSPESSLPLEGAPKTDPYFSGVQKVMEMIQ